LFSALVLVATASAAFAQPATGPYKVLRTVKVGGEGGFDYVYADAVNRRLYVPRSGPTTAQVMVFNLDTLQPVGAIPGVNGHGAVVDPKSGHGFLTSKPVAMWDAKTLAPMKPVEVQGNPDGILYEPVTKTVWAFNGRSSNATVIDTKTQKVVSTIPLPGKPEFPVADGKGTVFVNIETKNEIVRLDAKTLQATATWPLSGCESPSGLAIDRVHRRLFSVCDGKKMAVTDANSGKSLATPEIGDGPDAAAFDPTHQLAFSSNGDGTLTVVDTASGKFNVIQNLATAQGARTMSFDSSNGRIYLVTAEFGPRPAATAQNPRPRPAIVPGSFTVLVVGRK